ncbi:hypothetical protein EMMF5_004658 [Cystobasidiomycetes sp. EMM_F5]
MSIKTVLSSGSHAHGAIIAYHKFRADCKTLDNMGGWKSRRSAYYKQRILGILATVKEISIELGKTAPVVTLSALDIVTSIISEKQEKGCEPFRNLHHAFLANLEMPATAFYKHVCPIAQQSATLTLVDLFLSQDRDTADWPSPNIQAGHWVSADCVTFAASRQQPHRQSIVLVLPMFVKARSIVFDWSAYLLRLAREELGKAGPSGLYRVFAFSERYKGDLERFFGGLHAHVLANRRSDGDAMNFLGPLSRKPTIILMLPKAWVQLGEAAVRNTTSLNETAGFAFDIKVEQSATSCSD